MTRRGLGKTLADKGKTLGARFLRHDVRAIRPESDGGWRIETDAGPLSASKLLIAAGA
jgi:glycine/D-amino acid oxidase-like deaminating enzyme